MSRSVSSESPLISCILPTHNRRAFLPQALEYFRRQDYPELELIVIDDGSDTVSDLVSGDSRIRYFRLDRRHTIGAKRNFACREARGEIIIHWDDDDWAANWRVSYQAGELQRQGASICGLGSLHYFEPSTQRAWRYTYSQKGRPWVAGNSLCYRKSFWEAHPFPEIDIGEDARFVWQARHDEVARLDNSRFLMAVIHGTNASAKDTGGAYWQSAPLDEVAAILGPDASRYIGAVRPRQSALVTASLGLGDILRVTPLIRALYRLGYVVDVLLDPDFPETATLLEGAPEIRNVFVRQNHPKMDDYDFAAFTAWSRTLRPLVRTKRAAEFDRAQWLRDGDTKSVEAIAREVGWTGPLPPPLAQKSSRQFDLAPGTVALHPGCKRDWPWKKWHGFDELAALLPHAVLVGAASDLNNAGTYFSRQFEWPATVTNYAGKLNLLDTAALISQCGALVSNDSGIMHLAAALGVRTLGIFGITSPAREAMPLPNMIPVSKGLPCESACRQGPWGRTDCQHHLACLKTLTAAEVVTRIKPPAEPAEKETPLTKPISLTYYGHVFDATGYGAAARAYIRALQSAGIDLSVVDLSAHKPQVADEDILALLDRPQTPDFHLFHGIPHVWAQRAFRVNNAIAMTVWETDTMPSQWRNTLNHVREVWLPCNFNVDVFQRQLQKPIGKLPHPFIPRNGHGKGIDVNSWLGLAPEDFVFFSVFEWQDRKCPEDTIRCHLRTFRDEPSAVLVVKANHGAASVATAAMERLRSEESSSARVQLYCEGWSEDHIAALHRRGDCYVSLHRGEGWGYPLFDAALNGTPVVATAYGGPMDYLIPTHHQLVPFTLTPVRQRYMYYHSRMQWAQPDIEEACRRLRWVFENRDEARELAQSAAQKMSAIFSLEAVGRVAKARLTELLARTDGRRWHEVRSPQFALPAGAPIAPEWFDQDYFEHGLKSNWKQGYRWEHFKTLFLDTAAFLRSTFPGAATWFDAGCAKGFLVRAFRESGCDAWGCDVSRWAVDHVEPLAAEFVECAPAESAAWARDYDVILAFHLLSQMTEEQISTFLSAALAHARIGIAAVIPVFESSKADSPDTGDPAHITRRGREWWHERFLAAGWIQDPMHHCLQSAAQRHPLATAMGWQMFLYSAGKK